MLFLHFYKYLDREIYGLSKGIALRLLIWNMHVLKTNLKKLRICMIKSTIKTNM